MMDEEVVLLLMLKLLRKARNVGVLFRYLRACENFIYNSLFRLYCFIAEIYKKTKILNVQSIFTQRMRRRTKAQVTI